MKVSIKLLYGGVREEIKEVSPDESYEDVLLSLHINPETVIVFCNGNPVPLDEKVTPFGMEVLRIVSGG